MIHIYRYSSYVVGWFHLMRRLVINLYIISSTFELIATASVIDSVLRESWAKESLHEVHVAQQTSTKYLAQAHLKMHSTVAPNTKGFHTVHPR
ncbi:hypothetical protein TNCT_76821 [Trichonephila clavata]|uniref:Uncharacterized protein n=1 Tax=Trichonephila clavata TaxID=2740835 RepID=A0A8X6H5X3_TRICU|nr:hypothetical protein TNCT_76821 [Trichonephila clavata]